jgi:hypothetical protein
MSGPEPTFADLVDQLDDQKKAVLKFVCSRVTRAIFDEQPFLLLLPGDVDEDTGGVEIHSSQLGIDEARELLGDCTSMLMDISANTEAASSFSH